MAQAFITTKQNYANFDQSGISGVWIDLDYIDNEMEFRKECLTYHWDESDIVIADIDDVPHLFIIPVTNTTFYSIDKKYWEWKTLPIDEQKICTSYWEYVSNVADINYILDKHMGYFENAQECITWFHDVPEIFKRYINYDEMLEDITQFEGLAVVEDHNGFHIFCG